MREEGRYLYHEREAAEEKLAALLAKGKRRYFIQPIKEPLDADGNPMIPDEVKVDETPDEDEVKPKAAEDEVVDENAEPALVEDDEDDEPPEDDAPIPTAVDAED